MEWNWGSTDAPRAARAAKVKVNALNREEPPSIECIGSEGNQYFATLEDCTCTDFSINQMKKKPAACKHMVRLAMELGLLDKDGLTPRDQFLKLYREREDFLARCAWYYYVLDAPFISDAEYDRMKAEYMVWRGEL